MTVQQQDPHVENRLHYGAVCRPKVSRTVSGDTYLIQEDTYMALIAVIDGLGSGQEAAQASNRARDQIVLLCERPLAYIFQACHQALRDTRGAVMAILRIDFQAMDVTFAGVGNISIYVQSAVNSIKPITRNGIVGHRLPRIQEFRYPYTPGDLFVMHSDGISQRFSLSSYQPIQLGDDLQRAAEDIATHFGKDEDDVTLVLAREVSSVTQGAAR